VRQVQREERHRSIPDPLVVFVAGNSEVLPTGEMTGTTDPARRLILLLDLNRPELVRFRQLIIGTVRLARLYDPDLYQRWMGYPDDLPNLDKRRANGNTRQEGIEQSYFARKQRGELPETY